MTYELKKQNNTIVVVLKNPNISSDQLNKLFNEFVCLYQQQNERFCVIFNFGIYVSKTLDMSVMMNIVKYAKDVWPVTEKHLACFAIVLPPENSTILNVFVEYMDKEESRLVVCTHYAQSVAECKKLF